MMNNLAVLICVASLLIGLYLSTVLPSWLLTIAGRLMVGLLVLLVGIWVGEEIEIYKAGNEESIDYEWFG